MSARNFMRVTESGVQQISILRLTRWVSRRTCPSMVNSA